MKLDRPDLPYMQIVEVLRERILSGDLRHGDIVMPALAIMQQWDVSLPTATKVLATLRSEGYVETSPGTDTVICTRPAARVLVTSLRQSVAREAIKVDVPADLTLLKRLHQYRLDHDMDIRDQVAIAVDEWLTAEGY